MNNDILQVFKEFVEEYNPEEPEENKEESIPEPEISEEEEAARCAKEDSDREKQMWIQNSKEKRDAAFKMISAQSEKVLKKRITLIDFLTVQAHFDRYTVRNCLLIASQLPGATRLKAYDEWKDEGSFVKKGTKAITLIEPGDEYFRTDGSVARHYNTRALFDISQVTGGKYPQKDKEPEIAEKLRALFKTVESFDIKPCSYGEDGGRAAFFQAEKRAVYINKTVGIDILYPQLCVELAHAVMANNHKNYTRKQYGSACEMVGYIICVRNHVSVTEDAIPLRIAPSYEELKEKEVIKVLEEVRRTANIISNTMRELVKSEEKHQKSEPQPKPKGMV